MIICWPTAHCATLPDIPAKAAQVATADRRSGRIVQPRNLLEQFVRNGPGTVAGQISRHVSRLLSDG
jgi:hypothetical protein